MIIATKGCFLNAVCKDDGVETLLTLPQTTFWFSLSKYDIQVVLPNLEALFKAVNIGTIAWESFIYTESVKK